MAYGKFRDGVTSVGRSASNYLQDGRDDTFMTRRRPGVLVRKSGDFTNIFQSPLKFDGYYSLGEMAAGGTRIVGSGDGFLFSDRGPAESAGGFTVAQLAFYGKGYGVVTEAEAIGGYTNFDDRLCAGFKYNFLRTRNGRELTPYYQLAVFIPNGRIDTFASTVRGNYWFDGVSHKFFSGVHFPMMDGGQQVQAFALDNGDGIQGLGETVFFPNQLGWYSDPLVLAPGVLMKMDRYLRPGYTPSLVDVVNCPGLFFTFSVDAGQTWNPCGNASMWEAEMATIVGLAPVTAQAARFNNAVGYAGIVSAPLDRRYSVCLARVPYYPPGSDTSLRVRVKLGIIDALSDCSMTETMVLFDGEPDAASIYCGRGLLATPGGVLIYTRDVTSGVGLENDAWKYPATVRITTTGYDLADWAIMPRQESHTGIVSGYDTRTMVCPMWDGRHSIFRSRDYGKTWVRAGTVATGGLPPNGEPLASEEQFSLKDFGVVTFLRNNDLPANATPLTPWLSDSRLPDPTP